MRRRAIQLSWCLAAAMAAAGSVRAGQTDTTMGVGLRITAQAPAAAGEARRPRAEDVPDGSRRLANGQIVARDECLRVERHHDGPGSVREVVTY